MQQSQNYIRQYRFLVEDASTDLGTVVIGYIKEWIFGGKCTSTLPDVMRRSHRKIRKALDCVKTTLATTMHQVRDAQSRDTEIITVIEAQYSSPLSRHSLEQIEANHERLNATRCSLSILAPMQTNLIGVTQSHQLEHKRLMRLNEDTRRLGHFSHHLLEGAVTPEGQMQEGGKITWDYHDLHVAGLGDAFLSLGLTVINDDDEKTRQFQSCFYSTSPNSKA